MLLCVVHPSAAVREEVTAAAPSWVAVTAGADVRDLSWSTSPEVVVVALDPARTSPADVVGVLGGRPHVLSISNLYLDVPDPAVDSTLPLRRLTPQSLARHLGGLVVADLSIGELT